MKIFNIIDPGMVGKLGHHREINVALGLELLQRGYKVNIYAHQKYTVLPNDPVHKDFKIIPHFSTSPYFIYSNELSDIELYIKHQNSEYKFNQELNSIGLQGDVHLSNLFSYQLKTIAKLNNQFLTSACIHVHPNRFTDHGEFLWKKTMVEIYQQLHNFKIFAIEEPLLHEIDRMTSHGQGVGKIPFPLNHYDIHPKSTPSNRIGILGSLRQVQGSGKINHTLKTINSMGFDVLLQDSVGLIKSAPSENVKKIDFLDRLSDAFKDCDAVLLDYEPEAYRFMGSGVMWEALAYGTPFFYTKGTALASLALKYNVGIPFSFHDASSLKQALGIFKENLKFYESKSLEASKIVRTENSVANYVDRII